jgi:hypothetical protein
VALSVKNEDLPSMFFEIARDVARRLFEAKMGREGLESLLEVSDKFLTK